MTLASPPHRFTAEHLLSLPNNNGMELVDGEIVEKNVSFLSSKTASRITGVFDRFLESNLVAELCSSEMGYQCFQMLPTDPERMRKPDVTLIKKDRVRQLLNRNPGYMPIYPDLAVEVVSTNDTVKGIIEKLHEYRLAGFPLIWIVEPLDRTVTVYPNPGKRIILGEEDDITAPDALPGFTCKVADLFPRD